MLVQPLSWFLRGDGLSFRATEQMSISRHNCARPCIVLKHNRKLKVFGETQNSSWRVLLWLSWCLHFLMLQMHVLRNLTKSSPNKHAALVGSKSFFYQTSTSTRKIHPHLSTHIHTGTQPHTFTPAKLGYTFWHTNIHTHMGTRWHTQAIQKWSMEIQC